MNYAEELFEPCKLALRGDNPPSKRSFPSHWSEITYLIGKTHYWLYVRDDQRAARRYADRLRQTCEHREIARATDSVDRAWALALIQEANGRWRAASRRRDRFGHLLSRLYDEADRVDSDLASYLLCGFGTEVVRDHFARLANDYRRSGRNLAGAKRQANNFAAKRRTAAEFDVLAESP